MSPVTITSEAIGKMTPRERSEVFVDVSGASAPVGRAYLVSLDAKIRAYESRYEIPTSALVDALRSEHIRETAEICDWLFWADVRERIGQARPK